MMKVEFAHDAERDLIDIFLYGIEHFGWLRPRAP
jgi:plasmid stabilization system protein ParE